MSTSLEQKVQYTLALAIANGIKYTIEDEELDNFCADLVSHFNSNIDIAIEASGDSDGILVMDFDANIILTMFPKTTGIKFAVFNLDMGEEIFKSIIHVIDFLRLFFETRPDTFTIIRQQIGVTTVQTKEETRSFPDEGFTIV